MFGYIRIHKSELKFKEYELYKGLYCSLCKRLGNDYGLSARMTLNYDFTFFLLARMAIKDDEVCFNDSHCSFNPRKKCSCIPNNNNDLAYTAALSIVLTYNKLKDDLHDSRLLKKIPSAFLIFLFKRKYKKAKSKYPQIFEEIELDLSRQTDIEKKESVSLDECADPSAVVLGKAFSYGICEEYSQKSYNFGYGVGRLVYILDAADDIEKDRKNGSFNPFLKNEEKYLPLFSENVKRLLNITADETAKTYEQLPIKRFKAVCDNVIFYGFEDSINKIIEKEE